MFFFLFFFLEKLRLDISCEQSARVNAHLLFSFAKSYFSEKYKKKKNRMLSATIFLRTSRVSVIIIGSTVPHMLRRAGVSY